LKSGGEPRVVFGFHAVLARLRADPQSVIEIFLDEARQDARMRDLAATAERSKVRVMRVPAQRLDGFGGRHQGVIARVEMKSLAQDLDDVLGEAERPMLLVLDGRPASRPRCRKWRAAPRRPRLT
jgi:23S rRNA (guanosine2251-2'-O)-methyltransferase